MAESDLSSEERDTALRVALEMLEADQQGMLWATIQSLRWSVADFVALARVGARYCPAGVPRTLPEVIAHASDLTVPASLPPPPAVAMGSGVTRLDLPPGGVLGCIEPEISDGIPSIPDDGVPAAALEEAQTGLVIDHTGPVLMPDGRLGVMKREIGFPLDSAGGHGRSGEM